MIALFEAHGARFDVPLDEEDLRVGAGCDELLGRWRWRVDRQRAEEGVPFRAGEGGFPLRRNNLASWAAFQAGQSRMLENQRMGW